MVFFLTDGHPTVGVTDTLVILDNIRQRSALTLYKAESYQPACTKGGWVGCTEANLMP